MQENTILYSLLLFTITATISISAMVICSTLPLHTWITGPSPRANVRWAKIVLRKITKKYANHIFDIIEFHTKKKVGHTYD